MPPRTSSMTAEERALAEFPSEREKAAQRVAAELGRAPGTKPVGDAERVRQFGLTDPLVTDRDALAQQIATTGVPPEMLDPNNPHGLQIAKERPDLAPLYAQPAPNLETANILATFAEHPFRPGLFAGFDDPQEMVAEAKRLERLWRKSLGEPDEAMAAPDEMPTMGG